MDLANALVGRYERAAGETPDVHQAWGDVAVVQGEIAGAIRHYKRVYEDNPSSSINLLSYSYALILIGEFETALEVIALPAHKVGVLRVLGRHDEAIALLEILDPVIEFNLILRSALDYFVAERQFDAAIAYAEGHFGDLESLIEHFDRTNGQQSTYMPPLAFSYLQMDKVDEFEILTEAMADSANKARTTGDNNAGLWYFEAMLAALTGSDDDALRHAQKIVDNGGVGVAYFISPIFDQLQNNAVFQNLNATLLQRANNERAKLGLDPYLPLFANN